MRSRLHPRDEFHPNNMKPLCTANYYAVAESKVGVKFDEGKPRMDLLPPELLTEVAKVLTFGANKYSERNWEKGMDWGRVYGALQRHLNAWASREGCDKETGFSHLSHAACCIAFLIAYEKRNVGEDTRG